MKQTRLLAPVALAALASLIAFAADEKPRGGGEGKRGGPRPQESPVDDVRFIFRTDVPAHPLDVVLGRPTKDSVTVSALAYEEREGVIAFGEKSGALAGKTSVFPLKKDEPAEVTLKGLKADSRVFYQLSTRTPGETWKAEPERSFRTQRAPGSAFTFTVQADPHLDYGVDTAVYEKSLANALAAKTDFHIDLGDTFMVDKRPTYTHAAPPIPRATLLPRAGRPRCAGLPRARQPRRRAAGAERQRTRPHGRLVEHHATFPLSQSGAGCLLFR